jgi:hypothetical protein
MEITQQQPIRKARHTYRSMAAVLLFLGLWAGVCRADDVPCQLGDRPQDIANHLLTDNTELAHPAIELPLPSSEHSIVVLRRPKDDVDTNYQGWVLVPVESQVCSYRTYELPKMIEPPGLFEIHVEAVFGATVGAKIQRDLVILFRYHRNGAEHDNGYASYIYRWTGSGFESQPKLAGEVVGLKTATAVRSKLRSVK